VWRDTEQYEADAVVVSVSVDSHVVGLRRLTYTFSSLRLARHLSAFYCRLLDAACHHHHRHQQQQQQSGLDAALADAVSSGCSTTSLAHSRLFSVYRHDCTRNY